MRALMVLEVLNIAETPALLMTIFLELEPLRLTAAKSRQNNLQGRLQIVINITFAMNDLISC